MKGSRAEKRRERKRRSLNFERRIQHRLRDRDWEDQSQPMFTARNIHYEIAERLRGLDAGGIGAIHRLARQTGLIDGIDARLDVIEQSARVGAAEQLDRDHPRAFGGRGGEALDPVDSIEASVSGSFDRTSAVRGARIAQSDLRVFAPI